MASSVAGSGAKEPIPNPWKEGRTEIELPSTDGLPPDQQALAQWMGKAITMSIAQRDLQKQSQTKRKPRMLLVSNNLELHELLIKACLDKTMVVPIDYGAWSLQELRDAIQCRFGPPAHQFASVGLIDHGKPGEFCLLKCIDHGKIDIEDLDNEKHADIMDFFKWLAMYVQEPADSSNWKEDLTARVDLMACNTFQGDRGMKLIAHLEVLTKVNWTASSDQTGNVEQGYNWIMESEHGLGDISADYFERKRLAKWTKCAGLASKMGRGAVAGGAAGAVTGPGAPICAVAGAFGGFCEWAIFGDD